MTKERPILFSAPMVRAILNGTKSQTRRLVRIPEIVRSEDGDAAYAEMGEHYPDHTWHAWMTEYPDEGSAEVICPYGAVGDSLWVRETFQINHYDYVRGKLPKRRPVDEVLSKPAEILYLADGEYGDQFEMVDSPEMAIWRPSIFMPRWASRLVLEVTSVRVERLQAITDADALAEGVLSAGLGPMLRDEDMIPGSSTMLYRNLWDKLNAKRAPWASNPWVWVVEFKLVPA